MQNIIFRNILPYRHQIDPSSSINYVGNFHTNSIAIKIYYVNLITHYTNDILSFARSPLHGALVQPLAKKKGDIVPF